MRHNEVRDITATLLTEVCHEPHLQSLLGESLSHRSAITEDGARRMSQFMDSGVEDLKRQPYSAQSNHHGPLSSVYRNHEQEKRRLYDQ